MVRTRSASRRIPKPLLRLWLLPCGHVGKGVTLTGPVLVRGRGKVVIGDGVVLDAKAVPIELTAGQGGRIEIRDGAYVGPGTSIEACQSVTIGAHARVEAFVKILDSNFHFTTGEREESPADSSPRPVPIEIGALATIGTRSTLVPGSRVGDRSIVQPDSLVSRRVPPAVTVGGVPARLVRGAV
jgi:carbonic anhydrase/acetyltransferase-like protein (isoleucine patch superfamily)